MKKLTFIACTALFLVCHQPATAQTNSDSNRVTRTTTTDYTEHHDYNYWGLLGLLGLLGLRGRKNVVVDNRVNNPNDRVVNRP
jgi:hypothetical protein